jgi:hypothetical protein
MESKTDKNTVKEISTIILSMSLNIDNYNKTSTDKIEEPKFSDFFDYFSKTKNIWLKTIKTVLEDIETETNTISEDGQKDIAAAIVTDMINYMYINNIQFEFKKELKNIDTKTARKYIEDILVKSLPDVVEVTIGNKIDGDKIDIKLITQIGFRQIITNIENDKVYTIIRPPGQISSLYSGKFGGKRSKKYRKNKKLLKSKKNKKTLKSKKNKNYKKYRFSRKI